MATDETERESSKPGGADHVRAFVAIHVPVSIRTAMGNLQEALQMPTEAVRWTPIEQMHLTLEFLGNVPVADIEAMTAALEQAASKGRRFTLRAEGLGAFPSMVRPRVIWVGLSGESEALGLLQGEVHRAIAPWSGEPSARAYHPHLTLGRVREIEPRSLRKVNDIFRRAGPARFDEWRVDGFALMQSKLSPQGARHSVLAKFHLPGAATDRRKKGEAVAP